MSDPLGLISSKCFHRRVILDTAYGPLTISFADIGGTTGPALLFLPGMFASRYLSIPMHVIAERAGVRLLVVDRPGMGASTNVPLAQRIAIWVDMLPRLLAHLGIPRVNLVSHSAGTIYLLNTWAQCRELVGPVVAFLGNFHPYPSLFFCLFSWLEDEAKKQDAEKKTYNSVLCYSAVGGSRTLPRYSNANGPVRAYQGIRDVAPHPALRRNAGEPRAGVKRGCGPPAVITEQRGGGSLVPRCQLAASRA